MSNLTLSVNQRLAAALNAADAGANASHLRMTTTQLVAALRNHHASGADLSHLTTSYGALLASLRNELSDAADVSHLTTSADALLDQVLVLVEAEDGGGEEPGGGDLLFEADFTGGTYAYQGAPATLADILVQDLEWGPFDPQTAITAEGLGQSFPIFSSQIFTAFGAGLTLVIDWTAPDENTSTTFEANDAPAYENGISLSYGIQYQAFIDYAGLNIDQAIAYGVGPHRTAVNLAEGRMAMSIDGDTVYASDVEGTGFLLLAINVASGGLLRITAMNGRALVSEAELPALSAP